AEWTPITTISAAYLRSSFRNCGRTWTQLIQQKVQKSSRTSLPRRSLSETGRSVPIQSRSGGKSGALTAPANRGDMAVPRTDDTIHSKRAGPVTVWFPERIELQCGWPMDLRILASGGRRACPLRNL